MRKWYKPGIGNKRLKTLDKWFSVYIRLRDTDDHGFGRCVTCQRVVGFAALDCGHYKTRNNISTRFDPKNAHAQCQQCNRFMGGESIAHGIRIAQMYGQSEFDLLEARSRSMMKLLPFEIKDMRELYKALAKELWEYKSDQFKNDYKNLMR